MVSFEIIHFFYWRCWRWLTLSGLILGIFFIMGLMVNGSQNIWSYLVAILTQQFICIVIISTIFSLIVVDLILADCSAGLIGNVLSRTRSRFSWLIAKICVLFVSAFLFTVICFLAGFFSGSVLGFPIESGWKFYSLFDAYITPFQVFVMIFITYIFSLTSFGMLVVSISLVTRSSVVSSFIGAIVSFMSYVFWMKINLRPYFKWTPTGQMMFLSKFPNRLTENLFTMSWSYAYTVTLFVFSFVLCWVCLRKMDLSKKD